MSASDAGGSGGGDGHGDAAMATDAGPDQVVDCGAGTCRFGQACVAGACQYPTCAGVTVPGDYATVQSAVDAIGGLGGTICIAAGTFPEDVIVQSTKPLVIQGVSATRTALDAIHLEQTADVSIRGISTTKPSDIVLASSQFVIENSAITCDTTQSPEGYGLLIQSPAPATTSSVAIRATKLATVQIAAALDVRVVTGFTSITLDGVELTGTSATGVNVDSKSDAATGDVAMSITNSSFHDCSAGITADTRNGEHVELTVENNTITCVELALYYDNLQALYFNNLFVGSSVAVSAVGPASCGNNLLYDNATNYGGTATAGPSYLTANPLLDAASPPGLSALSPARGAGDPAHAPAADYWGRPRGPQIDLGAVQSI
ncbi:MAG TPA: hypothetical protein VMJ10_30710 [Kofleriaceae bacterium]|nr:hypothetical protein [Kofleriaceae bacterium]